MLEPGSRCEIRLRAIDRWGQGGGPVAWDDAEEESRSCFRVLNFYERFAQQNETNSRLKAEAARAYFKVGSLLERLDRFEEAERAMARAFAMFEDLVAEFPERGGVPLEDRRDCDHDRSLVGRCSRTLCRWKGGCARARELVDQLAGEPRGSGLCPVADPCLREARERSCSGWIGRATRNLLIGERSTSRGH